MGAVRIIAGSLRGRRIRVPEHPGVRPTPDRVREALFNVLGQDLSGAVVLDAYAGAGLLGFEALSRGARRAVFIEGDRLVAAGLEAVARELGVAARSEVLVGPVLARLREAASRGPYDLILADPPYGTPEGASFLRALMGSRALADRARVVVERDRRDPVPTAPKGLSLVESRRYGRTCLDFYRLEGGDAG